jgi:hypothetical protein
MDNVGQPHHPISVDNLRCWVAAMDLKQLAISTMSQRLRALHAHCRLFGFQCPSSDTSAMLVQAIKGACALRSAQPAALKYGIDLACIRSFLPLVHQLPSTLDSLMLDALLHTGVTGLLRNSEIACHDPTHCLRVKNVVFHPNLRLPNGCIPFSIFLPNSKTDHMRTGVSVLIEHTRTIAAMSRYLSFLASSLGDLDFSGRPLFVWASGKVVTVSNLHDTLADLLRSCGTAVPPNTRLSLRSGGASDLLSSGMDVDSIKLAGRWKSSAWRHYINHHATASLAASSFDNFERLHPDSNPCIRPAIDSALGWNATP